MVDDSSEQLHYHRKEAYFPPGICFKVLAVKIISFPQMRGYRQLLCLTGDTTDLATLSLVLLYYCINVAMPESFICDVYVSALQDFIFISGLDPILEPNWA